MRNGGKAWFAFDFGNLLPVDADADPTTVEVEMREPDGTETTWTFGADPEVVKDATGQYHMESPALVAPAGGVYVFLARGPGYPEVRCEIQVEPAYW